MSNDVHLEADFTLNIPHFEADFTENEQPDIQADFIIETGRTEADFKDITGGPYDNSALAEALNQKADTSTVATLSETVDNNYNTLDSKIDSTQTALENDISALETDLNEKINNEQSARIEADNTLDTKIDTHIADKTNPHEVTKAQVGLGNVDNTSDLDKPISTATQTALNGKQNTINDLSEIRSNASNGKSAYNTIQTYGDIVTYDASSFATNLQGQKADTALQPNDDISKLNNDVGYITSASLPTVNNSTITIQRNNVTAGDFNLNQSNNETINISVPTQASDVNALPDTTTINDLTTTIQQNAINSGATSDNIGQIATNTSNLNSLQTTVTNNYNTLDGRITSEVSTLNTAIGTEATNRQSADNNLQSQIDAIVSSSDVFDIVGTYAELQAYDISTVPVNDIIKVLIDSTHSNAATYYRCVETGSVKSWSYIGSEGAYYTKSESDSLFVEQTTTVNGKALSNNINLTATDVGALPSSTTIGNGILTIQNNGVDVDTFNANATSNKSINIVTPTKTSDLTNDSNFITGITSSDVTTALGYTPYNSTNPAGYTSNVGTVTSVNNTQPDANGNVNISVLGGANTDLSNLTATGEAHFQKPLVSGTNIKTVNNTSLLGSGNIDTNEIFVATYGTTTFQEVFNAYGAGKTVFVKDDSTTSGEIIAVLNYFEFNSALDAHFEFASSILNNYDYYAYSLDQDSTWSANSEQIPDTSNYEQTANKVTSLSSSSTNTQYPSAKSVIELLKTIYPVGSVYLSTNSTCPLASLFGTWTLVSSGRALWTGTGSNGNTTIAAGLPNIVGGLTNMYSTGTSLYDNSGAFGKGSGLNKHGGLNSGTNYNHDYDVSFSASNYNTIYSDNVTTVQPPAYVVNVWRRTA